MIDCDDIDVFVLLLSHSSSLGRCYLKKGRGSKTKIIEMALILEKLIKQLDQNRSIEQIEFGESRQLPDETFNGVKLLIWKEIPGF